MTVTHVGSTVQYSANWADIFGKGRKAPKAAAKLVAKRASKKQAKKLPTKARQRGAKKRGKG